MRRIVMPVFLLFLTMRPAQAQDLRSILQTHSGEVAKPSRNSVDVVLDALLTSGLPEARSFLDSWSDKGVWQDDASGMI